MKLRNKRTGKIGNFCYGYTNELCVSWQKDDGFWGKQEYNSLAELNKDWEDYEEPETYYYISDCVNIERLTNDHGYNLPEEIWYKAIERRKEIGNYFETREEAEKAVEKLKAWKRLEENGFRFNGWKRDERHCGDFIITATDQFSCDDKDLDLLFGGEDE